MDDLITVCRQCFSILLSSNKHRTLIEWLLYVIKSKFPVAFFMDIFFFDIEITGFIADLIDINNHLNSI